MSIIHSYPPPSANCGHVSIGPAKSNWVPLTVTFFGNRPVIKLSYFGMSLLRFFRRAIEKNYCVYPALDTDPLLENIRNMPEFQVIRKTAVTCYEKFGATLGLQ